MFHMRVVPYWIQVLLNICLRRCGPICMPRSYRFLRVIDQCDVTIASSSHIDDVLLSCWHLKLYRERPGMNGLIFVHLRLREDSITNEQRYFAVVNITRGWIHVRDDRFSKFWNKRICGALNRLVSDVRINWHAQRAWWKMFLMPSALPNVLLIIACRWIVGIVKILKNDAMETWGYKEYRNQQAEVYYEATCFCIARHQRQYRECASYAPCSWC